MRTITLTLNDYQIEALNAALLARLDAIEENISACDEEDESDAENIAAYETETGAIEGILLQLENAR